jgi:hypothetical protein
MRLSGADLRGILDPLLIGGMVQIVVDRQQRGGAELSERPLSVLLVPQLRDRFV